MHYTSDNKKISEKHDLTGVSPISYNQSIELFKDLMGFFCSYTDEMQPLQSNYIKLRNKILKKDFQENAKLTDKQVEKALQLPEILVTSDGDIQIALSDNEDEPLKGLYTYPNEFLMLYAVSNEMTHIKTTIKTAFESMSMESDLQKITDDLGFNPKEIDVDKLISRIQECDPENMQDKKIYDDDIFASRRRQNDAYNMVIKKFVL